MKFRAWHRGMREMDLILGRYIDHHLDGMDDEQMDEFERIMAYEDRHLLDYIMGKASIPDHVDSPLLRQIIAYTHDKDLI